jgi:cobalt/nickel transport system permease protein
MGLMAAFVYAGQLFNVPVAAGVSGHFLGALFAAVLLGPWQATLVMTAVITVQCLVHADGGLTALGLNVINMGVVGTMLGFGIYWAIRRLAGGTSGLFVGAAAAAWCSVVAGAALVSLQVWLCGELPAGVIFGPLIGIHAVIGLLEAAVTVGALTVVRRVRPDLLGLEPPAAEEEAAA